MEQRNAIVTGGLRGLGRAMALGLARDGCRVLAVGHIETDVAAIERELDGTPLADRVYPLVADLRRPQECNRVVAAAEARFGGVDILVNNAGLTFTYIDPARYRRPTMQKFWEVGDEIVDNVVATNYLAADRLARRARSRHGRAGLGPHRQRHDQARHDEPRRDPPLRRHQSGTRNGDRGVGQGNRGDRAHGQHRQPGCRRQHAGHGRGNARR